MLSVSVFPFRNHYFEQGEIGQDNEKRDFFNNMKLWRDRALSPRTWREVVFNSEIKQMLEELAEVQKKRTVLIGRTIR